MDMSRKGIKKERQAKLEQLTEPEYLLEAEVWEGWEGKGQVMGILVN